MKTFNIQVRFTPAYHPASNGAIERRHQTLKNAIKASLIDMGNEHGDKWVRALPWVLLGKRVQVQPDLDASAASLVFGKAIEIPGQLLGHPGPPLTNLQTRALLEELYKISAKPAIQTTSITNPINIAHTEAATHVYVKVDEPQGLSARFEGPYPVVSRPSRTTVQVRIGSFVSGEPRLQTYNWAQCKVAHMREGAPDGQRPRLGRKPASKNENPPDMNSNSVPDPSSPPTSKQLTCPSQNVNKKSPAKIQTCDTLSDKAPHPDYVKKGPIITDDMFQKWSPELLGIPSKSNRPVRSTRNPEPRYVDYLSWPVCPA